MGKRFLAASLVALIAAALAGCRVFSGPVNVATMKKMKGEVDRTVLAVAPTLRAELHARITDAGGSFGFCHEPDNDQDYGGALMLRKPAWRRSKPRILDVLAREGFVIDHRKASGAGTGHRDDMTVRVYRYGRPGNWDIEFDTPCVKVTWADLDYANAHKATRYHQLRR